MAQVYTIDKYRDILSTGFPYEFPEETLSLINFLAKEVGTHIPVTNPTFDGKGGKKKVNAGKSWDKAAPFKATVFEKHGPRCHRWSRTADRWGQQDDRNKRYRPFGRLLC